MTRMTLTGRYAPVSKPAAVFFDGVGFVSAVSRGDRSFRQFNTELASAGEFSLDRVVELLNGEQFAVQYRNFVYVTSRLGMLGWFDYNSPNPGFHTSSGFGQLTRPAVFNDRLFVPELGGGIYVVGGKSHLVEDRVQTETAPWCVAVDSHHSRLYAPTGDGRCVEVFTWTHRLTRLTSLTVNGRNGSPAPFHEGVVDSRDRLWVKYQTSRRLNGLAVFDHLGNLVIQEDLDFDLDGHGDIVATKNHIIVACPEAHKVVVFNLDGRLVDKLEMNGSPMGLAVSTKAHLLYVGDEVRDAVFEVYFPYS